MCALFVLCAVCAVCVVCAEFNVFCCAFVLQIMAGDANYFAMLLDLNEANAPGLDPAVVHKLRSFIVEEKARINGLASAVQEKISAVEGTRSSAKVKADRVRKLNGELKFYENEVRTLVRQDSILQAGATARDDSDADATEEGEAGGADPDEGDGTDEDLYSAERAAGVAEKAAEVAAEVAAKVAAKVPAVPAKELPILRACVEVIPDGVTRADYLAARGIVERKEEEPLDLSTVSEYTCPVPAAILPSNLSDQAGDFCTASWFCDPVTHADEVRINVVGANMAPLKHAFEAAHYLFTLCSVEVEKWLSESLVTPVLAEYSTSPTVLKINRLSVVTMCVVTKADVLCRLQRTL